MVILARSNTRLITEKYIVSISVNDLQATNAVDTHSKATNSYVDRFQSFPAPTNQLTES